MWHHYGFRMWDRGATLVWYWNVRSLFEAQSNCSSLPASQGRTSTKKKGPIDQPGGGRGGAEKMRRWVGGKAAAGAIQETCGPTGPSAAGRKS